MSHTVGGYTMARKRSEAELLQYEGQNTLWNTKIYEHHFIARAKHRIKSKLTRNAVKALLATIEPDDTEFKRCFIPQAVLWGGMKKRNGRNYEFLDTAEAEVMSGDGITVRMIENPKSFKVYNFFDGLVEYDAEKKGVWARLNPYLAPYYLRLENNMSVLQREVYFALSESFYKDLYEFILGCQDKQDINAFFRSAEWICEHFGLSANYLKFRSDLVKKLERAVNTICKTMETLKENTQFSIIPRFATTSENAKNNGKLLGFDFYIAKADGFTRLKDIPEYKRNKKRTQREKK